MDYNDANDDGIDMFDDFARPLRNKYERFVDNITKIPEGADSDYQRAFLKFITNFNGTGSNAGISLYRADEDLTVWRKLTLNEDDEIIPVPCL